MKIFNWEIRKLNTENTYSVNSDPLLFGSLRSEYSAMNLSTVFRCTDLISDSIASLPIRVVKEKGDCKTQVKNHPLNLVFSDGIANNLTLYHFMKLLIQSVILKGNGFALIQRASDGTVTGLKFLESGDVQIHYDKQRVNSLYYTCTLIQNKKIEPCNMIHLRKYSTDGVNGHSILSYASRTIRLSQAGENQATKLFSNGCNLSGVLTVHSNLTEEQRRGIHESWNKSMTDGGNGLAVLQGNMDYKPIQISPEDAQLLGSRLFQVDEICRFFGINPVLIGELSHSSYGSLEAAQQEFLLHCLSPYILMVEEEFTKKLFKPSEVGMKVNLDETAILRTDKQALANYYKTLLDTGVMCIDEVREALGMNPIGATEHVRPFTKVSDNILGGDNKQEQNENKDGNGNETV